MKWIVPDTILKVLHRILILFCLLLSFVSSSPLSQTKRKIKHKTPKEKEYKNKVYYQKCFNMGKLE